MERVSQYVFKVGSDNSDKEYFVDLTPNKRSCTCTHYAIQRNRAVRDGREVPECKHINSAEYEMLHLDEKEKVSVEEEIEVIRATTMLMQTLKDLEK